MIQRYTTMKFLDFHWQRNMQIWPAAAEVTETYVLI
jgi:hypothetical protein